MTQRLALAVGWVSAAALAVLASISPEQIEAWPIICPYRRFLGFECVGCGLTRATSLALHGRIDNAVALNALIVLVLPILAGAALWAIAATGRLIYRATATLSPATRADLRRSAFWSWAVMAAIGGVLVATPFALPHGLLEGWVGSCPAKAAGSPCSLCGMTTAFYLITEGQWREATASHGASIPLYLGLVGNSFAGLFETARSLLRNRRRRS